MRRILFAVLLLAAMLPAHETSSKAGLPAARVGDYQSCPQFTGVTPHVGGPILSGATTVLLCGAPAATVGSQCSCVGPPSTIVLGSNTVLIEGRPAAIQTSATNHAGTVIQGCNTVLIGN